MNKKRWFKWLRNFLILYLVVGVALYFTQDYFLLHPKPLPASFHYTFNDSTEERNVHYDSSTVFNVVRFFPKQKPSKGAVIYFHGNMENIAYYAHFEKNFTKNGYEVWMMDYPGFGKSTGKFSEQILYEEALQVYKMVQAAGYNNTNIIIYGKSLGTGIATELASVSDCKRLMLESPYYSIPNVAAHFFFMYPVERISHYQIPTWQFMQKVKAPVTIFHGTDDGVVPYSNTQKLKPYLKPGDEIITIEGGNHNNLNDYPLMHQKLDSLLSLP